MVSQEDFSLGSAGLYPYPIFSCNDLNYKSVVRKNAKNIKQTLWRTEAEFEMILLNWRYRPKSTKLNLTKTTKKCINTSKGEIKCTVTK